MDEDIRESWLTDLEQLRIVQDDSCRGLEGWIVVIIKFDNLYDYKFTENVPTPDDKIRLFFDSKQAAKEYASQWLMIQLTRAIDTLVIQVTTCDHIVTKALREAAFEWKDFVEWRIVK